MKKFSFAFISDLLFFTVCAFIIAFTTLRYFFKSVITALIIALGIALAVCAVTLFILLNRRNKKLYLLVSEREKKKLSLHLSVISAKNVCDLFLKVFDNCRTVNGRLENDKSAYYFNFKLAPLTADDVADVIRKKSTKRKRLLCCSSSAEALSFANDFDIEIMQIGQIYALLKDKKCLPEKYAIPEVKRANFFKRVKKRFNRKLCPSLFFSGFFLLFYSFFTFYPIWYIVTGGILMTLSAICVLIPAS
ncbi:MAG: hypothetical protein ACI4MS_06205 [Candidatus Coproplasma sp.]